MIEVRTGSDSDILKMKDCYRALEDSRVPWQARILSAHRTPLEMVKVAQGLREEGFLVSICAAGGAAHLPGMTASETLVPVIGLPIKGSTLEGIDSFLSIVQMPDGIPVATVGAGQDRAAAELALRVISFCGQKKKSTEIAVFSLGQAAHALEKEMTELAARLGVHLNFRREISQTSGLNILFQDLESEVDHSLTMTEENQNLVISCYFTPHPNTLKPWVEKAQSNAPIAMMGLNRWKNSILYAAQLIALDNETVHSRLYTYRKEMANTVRKKNQRLAQSGVQAFLNEVIRG